MSKTDSAVVALGCFGLAIFTLLSIVVSAILNGWVLSVMWGWFVVPVFDLPKLSIAAAIGISMVVSFLTYRSSSNDNKDKEQKTSDIVIRFIANNFFAPLFTLLIGYIVHLFM